MLRQSKCCAGCARVMTEDVFCCVQAVGLLRQRTCVVCMLYGCCDRGRVVQVDWVLRQRTCCVLCRSYRCYDRGHVVCCLRVMTEVVSYVVQVVQVSRQRTCCLAD